MNAYPLKKEHQLPSVSGQLAPKTYAIGELFAGAGGMALGVHKASYIGNSFRHVWASDMDKEACKTFELNLPIKPKYVVCKRVEELNFQSLPSIDGLIFGFPCNDFSLVGKQKGILGEYGSLYKWAATALNYFKPSFFVAENVSGIKSSNKNKDINIILKVFEREGYDININDYRFEEYGIPQKRHRVIITGFKKSLCVKNFTLPDKVNKQKSAREAMEEPPLKIDVANNEKTMQSPQVVERLKYIKPGQNAFNAKIPEELRLKLKSKAEISQIYKRLVADQPSYTITGSGGGGTHVYHWSENRALTNRERARLQTFPDNFIFIGGKESVRKQIGMAVPPEGAKLIFNQVLKALVSNNVMPYYAD